MCGRHVRAVGGEGALVSEARTSGHGRGVGAVAVVRMEEQRGEREQRAESMRERERESRDRVLVHEGHGCVEVGMGVVCPRAGE